MASNQPARLGLLGTALFFWLLSLNLLLVVERGWRGLQRGPWVKETPWEMAMVMSHGPPAGILQIHHRDSSLNAFSLHA